MIRVLYVSASDLVGKRFNGYNMRDTLLESGIIANMAVYKKSSQNPNIYQIKGIFWHPFNVIARKIEENLSVQSLFYISPLKLLFKRYFWKADIIHLQLIHTGFFSLLFLPLISKLKKTIWTLHDPWAFTGHCVHPFYCQRWKIGCGQCPNLEIPFKVKSDRTHLMWKIKKIIYNNSKLNIIVASDFMLQMALKSPLFTKASIIKIPFGIDLSIYKPIISIEVKHFFKIPEENFVILFRSTNNEFKGLKYIKEVLRKLIGKKNITIITLEERGLLNEFSNFFQLIELGWVDDEIYLNKIFNACDVFLMPSLAEAFGMMALEAMACKKVVVVFDGTSLSNVIFANNGCGISVAPNSQALYKAIVNLMEYPEIKLTIGQNAYLKVLSDYDFKIMCDRFINLYSKLAN